MSEIRNYIPNPTVLYETDNRGHDQGVHRPLLAVAQGEHHLPGHPHRRHRRQPDRAPSCCTSSPRTPTRTSACTSTRPVATSPACSPSTTRCRSSSPTSPPSASVRPRRPPPCCWPPARPASAWPSRTPASCIHQPLRRRARARPPTSSWRPRRSCACGACSRRSSPPTPASRSREDPPGHRP